MKTTVRRKEGQNCYTLAIVGNRTSHPSLKGCEGILVVRTRKGGAARPRCRRRRLLSRSRLLPPLTEDLWSKPTGLWGFYWLCCCGVLWIPCHTRSPACRCIFIASLRCG